MLRRKFRGPHRTRRHHSRTVPGPGAMGRVGNEGRLAERRARRLAPRILRPRLCQAPQENTRSLAATAPPSHQAKAHLAQAPQKVLTLLLFRDFMATLSPGPPGPERGLP